MVGIQTWFFLTQVQDHIFAGIRSKCPSTISPPTFIHVNWNIVHFLIHQSNNTQSEIMKSSLNDVVVQLLRLDAHAKLSKVKIYSFCTGFCYGDMQWNKWGLVNTIIYFYLRNTRKRFNDMTLVYQWSNNEKVCDRIN